AGLPAGVVESLAAVHARLNAIMPLLVGTSVGYMLSIRHRVPNLPAAFLCLSYVVIAEALLAPHPHAAATLILSLAILLPLGCVPLLAWLHRR
ncbi:PTS sugar transporter subunit IIC, partial [Burkholderia sp. SIMBA_019]